MQIFQGFATKESDVGVKHMKTAFSRKADNVLKTQHKRIWGRIKEASLLDVPKRLLNRLKIDSIAVKA